MIEKKTPGLSRISITRRLITALTGLVVVFWLIAVGLGAYVMNREFAEILTAHFRKLQNA
jgi:two-component system OmpR family sensor kinase